MTALNYEQPNFGGGFCWSYSINFGFERNSHCNQLNHT